MNIIDIVAKQARIYPKDPVIVEVKPVSGTREEIRWADFEERTSRLASGLLKKGVRKGDKVFLLGKNSARWLEVYFAILKTGAWATPLNFRFTDDDIRFCAKTAEPVGFFFDEEYAGRIGNLRGELSSVKFYVCIGAEGASGMEAMEDVLKSGSYGSSNVALEDEDECALYFTSGTTGTPKPVLIQQKSIMCTAITEATNHNLKHEDHFLMMPPMYHVAIGHMFGMIAAGGCSVLLTEQISPRFMVETIAKERISVVFLLVPWAMDLLEAFDKGELKIKDYDLGSWRLTHMGAQPIPPSLVKRLKAYFPQMEYDTNYGLSESMGPGPIHLGMENERKVGAIGKPAIMWDGKIVNEKGEDVKQGEVGEVVLKGAGVMKAYYKNPELTASIVKDGWLHTGDLGRVDEEGFIYLVDRKKDLIISGGENIYPVEVEEVILKHPKVHDVAVIGIPHERLVEVACAVIAPLEGETLTEEEIRAYCDQNLPRYKRPYRIIFDQVPRNPTGKIEKPKLREKYAKGS
ncbi:MAG TPA: class I adenylate-forming enzyme family protein [Syntrophorhabdaceae bacterium]|nr:class I adenylate-forming enzyme family protein [Syntrophorhabdaceae bacterium]